MDMYGFGVRLGFYIQSACCIIAIIFLKDGVEFGCLQDSLFKSIGVVNPENLKILEGQLFTSLVVMVSLPSLSQIVFQWHQIPESVYALGSTIVLATIFMVSCIVAMWGSHIKDILAHIKCFQDSVVPVSGPSQVGLYGSPY
jgi:hypothetical protein